MATKKKARSLLQRGKAAIAKQRGTRKRSTPGAPPRQIRYGVVGIGHIAQAAVLPAFAHAVENSTLVALFSGDPEKQRRLSRRYKVPVFSYEDFERGVREAGIEAVYIALPNSLHAEFTERAAKLGVHVLCEKPMATSVEECARMISACEAANVRLMIAYRLHFEPATLAAIEAVRSGRIGEARVFNSAFSFQLAKDNIRSRRALGGGVLWDIGIYCLNAARNLFRTEPIEVFAYTSSGRDARFLEVEEGGAVVLRFPGDRLASFTTSFGTVYTSSYELLGTNGRVRVENAFDYSGTIKVTIVSGGKTRHLEVGDSDQFAPELVHFSQCILTGKKPGPDGHEGLADVRVLAAIYESAQTGRSIRLEPVQKRQRPTGKQELSKPRLEDSPELVNVEEPAQG